MGLHNKNVSYLHTGSFNSDNFFTTAKLHAHTLWNCDKLSPKDLLLDIWYTVKYVGNCVIKMCYISTPDHPILMIFSPQQSFMHILSRTAMAFHKGYAFDVVCTVDEQQKQWDYATKTYHISVPDCPILTIFSPPQSPMLILSETVTNFPQRTHFWSSLYSWYTVKYVGELHNKNVSYLHTSLSNSNNFFTTTKLHEHTLQNCNDFPQMMHF